MAAVDRDTAHHEAASAKRADCPQRFSVFRQRQRLFAKFLLEREPFRGAWTDPRDAESCPGAIGTEAAERLRRAFVRFDAHSFGGDWLTERDDVRFHFH